MKVGGGIDGKMSNLCLEEQKEKEQGEPSAEKAEFAGQARDRQCCCKPRRDVSEHQAMIDSHSNIEEGTACHEHRDHDGCGQHVGARDHQAWDNYMFMGPMGRQLMGQWPHRGYPGHMGHPPMFHPAPMEAMMSPYGHPGMIGAPPMFALAQQHRMMTMWHKVMKGCKGNVGKHGRKRCRKGNDQCNDTTTDRQESDAQPMDGDTSQNCEANNAVEHKETEECGEFPSSESEQSGSDDDAMPPFMPMMMMMPSWGMRGMRHFQRHQHRMFKRAGRQCGHHKQGKRDSEQEAGSNQNTPSHKCCPRMRRRGRCAEKMCRRKCHGKRHVCATEEGQEVTEDTVPRAGSVADAVMEEGK